MAGHGELRRGRQGVAAIVHPPHGVSFVLELTTDYEAAASALRRVRRLGLDLLATTALTSQRREQVEAWVAEADRDETRIVRVLEVLSELCDD